MYLETEELVITPADEQLLRFIYQDKELLRLLLAYARKQSHHRIVKALQERKEASNG